MSAASTVTSLIRSTPQLGRMSLSLFWAYVTLGRQVRKARRAFEKQLMLQGMKKEDAKRLSVCYEELKNNMISMFKQGMVHSF